MKNLVRYTTIILLSVFIFSCEGEDGAVGPQGEQGEQGPQGDQGDQGDTGTANVIYSDWIDSGFSEPIATGGNFIIQAPDITQNILDTAAIMVYGKLAAGTVYPLPTTIVDGGTGAQEYNFRLFDGGGQLQIQIRNTEGNSIGSPLLTQYRYVIIPGGQAAGKSAQDLQNMSYQEVAALFNIND